MCGILGGNNDGWNYKLALDSMEHRGPDNQNIINDKFTLGFNRLSIIDLEKRSNQPFLSNDKKIAIVFNGEIYGYRELRKKLIKKGYNFKTESDTEVLLYSYLEWHDSFIDIIDGMFSIAIYDKIENKVKIFRDRPGIKPLYYYSKGNDFAFSSEISPLKLLIGKTGLTLDKTAIYDYLTYLYIPTPKTIFGEIKKVPPAHKLFFDLSKNKIECITPYWKIPIKENKEYTYDVISGRLKELIKSSVSQQLISDVPLGFFLSGGIDSSILVKEASSISKNKLKTFTIGFDTSDNSELESGQIVANFCDTDHQTKLLSHNLNKRLLKNMKKWYGEPYADTSACPTYLVSKFSKNSVTVAISGDGGDELFGGYRWYENRETNLSEYFFSSFFKFSLLRARRWFLQGTILNRLCNRFSKLFMTDIELQIKLRGGMLKYEKEKYAEKLGIDHAYEDYWYFNKFWKSDLEYRNRLRYLDFHTYLPDDILTKVDRVSMSVSLEVRVPFLSKEIIELCFSLPEELIFLDGDNKGLVKKMYTNFLPKQIIQKKKKGFSVPISYFPNDTTVQEYLLKTVYKSYLPKKKT